VARALAVGQVWPLLQALACPAWYICPLVFPPLLAGVCSLLTTTGYSINHQGISSTYLFSTKVLIVFNLLKMPSKLAKISK
jgi:hypothetical protein